MVHSIRSLGIRLVRLFAWIILPWKGLGENLLEFVLRWIFLSLFCPNTVCIGGLG
ncbi:hypothetical protein LINPERHAP2_LOCUS11412 [Linum perenne]